MTMGIESSVEKLDKYHKRLNQGKAEKIKASHVDKVIRKLAAKQELLIAEIKDTHKASKIERLNRKLAFLHDQQERALWLREQISSSENNDASA
jgi:wyosine [tRNA(Phe)-imidazoG37] synthetase (radical SAM superfamily)